METILSDEYFMREALKQAKIAFEEDEVPIGAVLVCHNRIVAKAYNQVEKLQDVTAHAEILALTSASAHLQSKYLKDCILYVTIEPCPMCAAASAWAQIRKIVYGAPDEKKGFSCFSEDLIHPKAKVISGVLKEDCRQLMQQFFKRKRLK